MSERRLENFSNSKTEVNSFAISINTELEIMSSGMKIKNKVGAKIKPWRTTALI